MKDKLVQVALLFGRGQTHVGVLVFLNAAVGYSGQFTTEGILDRLRYDTILFFIPSYQPLP